VSGFGQQNPDTTWYEWRDMRKKKADEEPFKTTLLVVQKNGEADYRQVST
jgi:hypothetical protein